MIDKLPDIFVKGAEFLLDFKKFFGIGYCCLNFKPVSYNAAILKQCAYVLFSVFGYFIRIKIVKCLSVVFSPVQYGLPAQSCLRPFKNQKFKQFFIIVQWNAPFL